MTDVKTNQKKFNVPLVFACACVGAFLGLVAYVKDWI